MQPNPVNVRLGRNRPQPRKRAQRKRVRQVANELVKESDWRGDLARSVLDVIETEERKDS